jgi:glycosyltransferase involved in cell wall biosynthesis
MLSGGQERNASGATVLFSTGGSFKDNASIIRAAGLGRALRDLGANVRFALADAKDSRELFELYGLEKHCHWVARGKNPFRFLTAKLSLGPGLIVHLINAQLAGQLAGLRARSRGATVVSDWDEWLSRVPLGKRHRVKWGTLEFMATRLSHAFVFSSRRLQRLYESRLGGRPSVYIPYGMSEPASDAGALSDSFILPAERAWIAYLGSLQPSYREDLAEVVRLAQACARMGLGLAVAGEGAERPWLQDSVRKLLPEDQTRFTGWLPFDGLDPFLTQPAIRACFLPLKNTLQNQCRCPNKILHYVKARKSVVTNEVGEAANLLGGHAFYYEYGNGASLESAVARSVQAAPQYDLDTFSWKARARAYLDFLKSLQAEGQAS